MQDEHFLKNIFSPNTFTKKELELIIPNFKKVNFSKNEYLLKEGIIENHYWFIESGFARSFVNDTKGNDIFFAILPVKIYKL